MSVVIRASGGAFTWTCTVLVGEGRNKRPCRHQNVAHSEDAAHKEYEAHKKQVHG